MAATKASQATAKPAKQSAAATPAKPEKSTAAKTARSVLAKVAAGSKALVADITALLPLSPTLQEQINRIYGALADILALVAG